MSAAFGAVLTADDVAAALGSTSANWQTSRLPSGYNLGRIDYPTGGGDDDDDGPTTPTRPADPKPSEPETVIPPEDVPLPDIPDEGIPLAALPQTGSRADAHRGLSQLAFGALTAMAGAFLIRGKKREEEK